MAHTNHKIVLRGSSHGYEERLASAALSPGNLLKVDSANKVLKHATEGAASAIIVAQENALYGKVSTDAYANGDLVPTFQPEPCNVIQVLAKPGVAYAVGDELIHDGAGQVKKASAVSSGVTAHRVVGFVYEAKDLSASGAVAALMKVQIA